MVNKSERYCNFEQLNSNAVHSLARPPIGREAHWRADPSNGAVRDGCAQNGRVFASNAPDTAAILPKECAGPSPAETARRNCKQATIDRPLATYEAGFNQRLFAA